jgi:hypothetical protein
MNCTVWYPPSMSQSLSDRNPARTGIDDGSQFATRW